MNYLNPNLSAPTGVGFLYEAGLRILFIRSQGTLLRSRAFGVGHPTKRSRTPSYTEQGIQSRTPGYTKQSQQIVYTGIFPLFEVEHLRQLCLISDSGEKLKHVIKNEIESIINTTLIIMVITDRLRIAELSYLAYRSSLNSKLTLLRIVDFFYLVQQTFLENSQVAIIRSSCSQMFFKIGILKNFQYSQKNTCVGVGLKLQV